MELNITNRPLEIEKLIGDKRAQALIQTETMVPGAGREPITPLMEEATLTITQSEVQHDRVVIDGLIYCQTLYRQGEETSVRALAATATLSQVLDLPGADPGMILRATGQVEHVECAYENGHMVFKVVCALHAQALKLSTVELIENLSGLDGIESRHQDLTSAKLSAESETTAMLREEVSLPSELDARMALMDYASIRLKDCQPDLGGVRITGDVQTETLIGTGVVGRPVAKVLVALPFDQVVEMPEWLTQNVQPDAIVKRLSTQVRQATHGEDSTLIIECELGVRAAALGQDQMRALTDAYTTGDAGIQVDQANIELSLGDQQMNTSEMFKGTLLMPDGAPGVGTVLAVRVRPALSDFTPSNGRTTLEGILECEVLYLPGGSDKASSVRESMPFAIQVDGELPPDSWIVLDATGAEAGALMSDRIEIRCTMKVGATYRKTQTVRVATGVTESGIQEKKDGLLLVWPGKGDDKWAIGKRYHIGEDQIGDLNGKAVLIHM